MKIGILTFHRAFNYGAFLQAYALSAYIKSIGHDVEFVDYWPFAHEASYQTHYSGSLRNMIKQFIAKIFSFRRKCIKNYKMIKLQRENLHIPNEVRYRTISSLNEANYDVVVYGSDQIWWNSTIIGYEGFDPVYWGEGFYNARKVCFAPSMGIIKLNHEDRKFIATHLNNFTKLSVRENQLRDLLIDFGCVDVPVVCDPTFLMSTDWWHKQCKPIKHRKNYILLFNLCKSKDTVAVAMKLSRMTRLKIIEITGSIFPFKYRNVVQTADSFQFLTLIKDADFVVTSSFHGTALSILLQKQFYCVGFGNKADRVVSLLDYLGMSDRYIKSDEFNHISKIEYSDVNYDDYVAFSKKYLVDSLK